LMINPAIIAVTAQSAHEALETLLGQHIECVVSDFHLPDMSGVKLCAEIKKTNNIPFIIYTGPENDEMASEAFAAGVDDYLKKEKSLDHYQVLARRIREAVEKRRAEELYRNAVEGSRDAFAITVGTITVFANQAMANLVGVESPAKLIGKDSALWVIDEEREQFNERTAARQQGKDAPGNFTFTIRRADGAIRKVESSVSLINYRGQPASLAFTRDVTDIDAVQKTLRDSEEKFRKLFDEALDGIFIADPQTGIILDCNQSATELVGRTKSELIGQPQRILHPSEEVTGSLSKTFRQHLGEKEGQVLRSKVVAKDGKSKDVEIKANITELSGGKVIQGIFRDISDRVQYEERLEALHRHATQLVQATSYEEVCSITLDTIESILGFHLLSLLRVKEGRLETVGRRGIPPLIQGLPLEGKGISVKAVREQRSILLPDVRKDPDFILALEGTQSELAVPIIVDGKAVAVINTESEKTNAFTDQDRKLIELFAEHVASTIDRMRAHEAEHAYQVKLQALYGHAQELTTAKSIEEIEGLTYEALTQTLGFRVGAFGLVEGNSLQYNTIWGFEGEKKAVPLDGPGTSVRAVKTGKTQHLQDVRQDPDFILEPIPSEHATLSELDVPIKLDGRAIAVINIQADKLNAFTQEDSILVETFAENVASAIGRLRYQTNLEKLVEEKTKELKDANVKLQNWNIELRKLDEMKTQFISAATHELKTPLASIIGYLELFNGTSHKSLSHKDMELLNIVDRNATRLQKLTEDLLDLQRIESGRREIKIEPADVEKLVQQSITEIQPLLNEKKQRINLTSTIAGKVVKADHLRINQVLYNLIGNASKFSPENTEIDVNIEEKEGAVRISIRDQGIGINADDIPKLFTPFSKIRKKNSYPGSGLGLSICKSIIELHGGKIWVESEGEEKGSTFIFTLP
ncbi:MAG: GAF domain-containing protein, partial [Candidatus Bathyarchaeia archaeon]